MQYFGVDWCSQYPKPQVIECLKLPNIVLSYISFTSEEREEITRINVKNIFPWSIPDKVLCVKITVL